MSDEFGKEIYKETYKKNTVGMKKDKLLELLNNKDLHTEIVFVDNGKTSKGYEFATLRLYTKQK